MPNISRFAALALLAIALLFAPAADAQHTCYSEAVTSQTSKSVPYSTHGKSAPYTIVVLNSSGVVVPSGYTVTKNSANDFTVSFGSSFTGTVKICRGYSYPTTQSWNFEPTYGVVPGSLGNTAWLKICGDCSGSNHAARSKNGHSAIMAKYEEFSRYIQSDGSVTVRVWIANGVMHFGVSDAGGGSLIGSAPLYVVDNNVSSFPSGVFDIFEGTISTSGGVTTWTSVTDKRGW